MILEHAILAVRAGHQADFEAAFEQARSLIAAQPGFRSLQLHRGMESPNRYLLLVEWDTLEDHTEGFRGSPEYMRWRELLHHFYDPFPTVEHFELALDQNARVSGLATPQSDVQVDLHSRRPDGPDGGVAGS